MQEGTRDMASLPFISSSPLCEGHKAGHNRELNCCGGNCCTADFPGEIRTRCAFDSFDEVLSPLEVSSISCATDSSRFIDDSSFQEITASGENPNSSGKSRSPGMDSSISSCSELTGFSNLMTEDIDFIKFYFDNNKHAKQVGKCTSVAADMIFPQPFFDCSPIPKINLDVHTSTPEESYLNRLDTSLASVTEELSTPVNHITHLDPSVSFNMVSEDQTVTPVVPLNSPSANVGRETLSNLVGLWNCPSDDVGSVSLDSRNKVIISEQAEFMKNWKFDSRPPCVGQEYSPESDEMNLPDTWKAIRNDNGNESINFTKVNSLVDSDLDLTEINPPSPILLHSAKKVGSWLQELEEINSFVECKEVGDNEACSSAVGLHGKPLTDFLPYSGNIEYGTCNSYMINHREAHNDLAETISVNRIKHVLDSEHSSAIFKKQKYSVETTKQNGNYLCFEEEPQTLTPSVAPSMHKLTDIKKNCRPRNICIDQGTARRGDCPVNARDLKDKIYVCRHDHHSASNHISSGAEENSQTKYHRHHHHYKRKSAALGPHLSKEQVLHNNTRASHDTTVLATPTLAAVQTHNKKHTLPGKNRQRGLAKKLRAISSYIRNKKTPSQLTFTTLAII